MRLALLLLIISQSVLASNEQGSGNSPESSTSNEDTQYIQVCTQANDSFEVNCIVVAVGLSIEY